VVIGNSASGTGDVTIDGWNMSTAAYDLQIYGRNATLGNLTTGSGDVFLYARNGDITVAGDNNSNGSGDINLLATGDIAVNEDLRNTGTGQVNLFSGWDAISGLTTPILFDREDIVSSAPQTDILFGTNGRIASGGGGTSVLLVATDRFLNNASAGGNAIAASNGRYLVYARNRDTSLRNGLTSSIEMGETFATQPPSLTAGSSRFIFEDVSPPLPEPDAGRGFVLNIDAFTHQFSSRDPAARQNNRPVGAADEQAESEDIGQNDKSGCMVYMVGEGCFSVSF
jgi:hypothetical protein